MLLSTRVDISSGLDHWPLDVKESHILESSDIPGLFNKGSRNLDKNPTTIGSSKLVKKKGERSRDGSSCQKARGSSIYFGQGDLLAINVAYIEHLTRTPV